MLNINPPPALQGDEQAQLQQVYRYLFRLHEQLNAASLSLDKQASEASVAVAKSAGIDPAATAGMGEQYASLVSLIVKTATIAQSHMDKVVTKLESRYIAESEWGTYLEEARLEVEDTAKYTLEHYEYGEEVFNIPEMAVDFDAYKIRAEGYIKRGIIGYDEERFPILGIAIGQLLKSRTVTIHGVDYEEFDHSENMATYTTDRLSFWINGVEVAYLSNSELVVTRIVVSDSIQLGDWIIDVNARDGMSIQKRIGSELDLSENNTINITAEKINAIADKIDLRSNEFIAVVANKNRKASRVFRQDELPVGDDDVKPGDLVVFPSTGEEYQAVEDQEINLQFALDADGNLYYATSNPEIYKAEMRADEIYASGFMVSVAPDGALGAPYGWMLVRDRAVDSALEAANAAVSRPDFERVVRLKDDGLHVGDNQSGSEVLIDSASVSIVFGGVPVSTFADKFVRLDNMQILRTQGGLAISVYKAKGGEGA